MPGPSTHFPDLRSSAFICGQASLLNPWPPPLHPSHASSNPIPSASTAAFPRSIIPATGYAQ